MQEDFKCLRFDDNEIAEDAKDNADDDDRKVPPLVDVPTESFELEATILIQNSETNPEQQVDPNRIPSQIPNQIPNQSPNQNQECK